MEKVEELIHLLNDDNLDKIEMCPMCVYFIFKELKQYCAGQGKSITDVFFCEKRKNLKEKLHI